MILKGAKKLVSFLFRPNSLIEGYTMLISSRNE